MASIATTIGNISDGDARLVDAVQYPLRDLKIATNNFSDGNRLGEGGFGVVYKGLIDGETVAIKRLMHRSSVQLLGDIAKEVSLLSSLNNYNLVKLLGFCCEVGHYVLVYEYISNGDLYDCLVDKKKREALNWERRFEIIRGIARGLYYLHCNSKKVVIHRDLKPANILLDEHYNPKIADFGISRIFETEKTHKSTSRLTGTRGYIAPELILQAQYSIRSDVYSYGMLVLEILAGCTIAMYAEANQETLYHVMWKQWNDKRPLAEVIDSSLQEDRALDDIARCYVIGLLCIQHDPKKRPDMKHVLQMLDNNISLPTPSFPGFFQEDAVPQYSHNFEFQTTEHVRSEYSNTSVDYQPAEHRRPEDASISELQPAVDARLEDYNFFELQPLVPKKYSVNDLYIVTNNFSRRLPGGDYYEFMGSLDGKPVVVEECYHPKSQLDLVITSSYVLRKKKLKFFTVKETYIERNILPLRHANIINILGYCLELQGALFIISEYPTNGLLYDFLYSRDLFRPEHSDWRIRLKVIRGVANGICYLHHGLQEKSVVHRNIKSSNIYLDDFWNAKLFGFRYVKVLDKNQEHINLSKVSGTDGYIAPELGLHGRLSTKSDVYSYGLVLLQVLVRNIAIHPPSNMKAMAWKHWRQNKILELLDPCLQDNCPEEEALRCFQIALLCIQDEPERRPSMPQVLEMLNRNNPLPIPSVPSAYAEWSS